MPISVGNVKQILDLGVSLVLQEGPITKSVHLLLCTLKAALLHRYFPDDSKHRRRFDKMTKEKRRAMALEGYDNVNSDHDHTTKMEDEKLHEEKTQEKEDDREDTVKDHQKDRQKLREKEKDVKLHAEDAEWLKEIRTKAKAKLEKMIRNAGVEEKAKELAVKLENTFQETANDQGSQYRIVAYERMRKLKT
jgi:hypothetical protein